MKRKVKLCNSNKTLDLKDLDFKKYRKKPVVIKAVQIKETFTVDTLEGRMAGDANDFLIIGIKGELYPCKPDIFAETYTRVTKKRR